MATEGQDSVAQLAEGAPPAAPIAAQPSETIAVAPNAEQPQPQAAEGGEQPMSKSAMKRLKRKLQWEESRDDRRKRRREKRHDTKARRRTERDALIAQGADPASLVRKRRPSGPTATVPVALLLDCDFESYMTDKERISLASQVTRSYSDNKYARYRAHLWIAGWRGRLRDRFRNDLGDNCKNWKGVGYAEGDFLEAAALARRQFEEKPGETIPALQRSVESPAAWTRDEEEPFPLPDPEPALNPEFRDVVYLTSESPYTLERLEPRTSYVIGGLVDKNREKGLCYRRAREKGIRTAKLPIAQFMVMQSRRVLATNHVVEIMLKWLECEDWGEAFMSVIPKRKGGRLRDGAGRGEGEGEVKEDFSDDNADDVEAMEEPSDDDLDDQDDQDLEADEAKHEHGVKVEASVKVEAPQNAETKIKAEEEDQGENGPKVTMKQEGADAVDPTKTQDA